MGMGELLMNGLVINLEIKVECVLFNYGCVKNVCGYNCFFLFLYSVKIVLRLFLEYIRIMM